LCHHHERLIARQSLRTQEEEDLIRDLEAPIDSKASPRPAATTQLLHEKLTGILRGKKVEREGSRYEMHASSTQRWERAMGYLLDLPLAELNWPWRRTSHPHPVAGVNTSIGTNRPRDGTDGVSAPLQVNDLSRMSHPFQSVYAVPDTSLFLGF
jgi:hypothetical protein